MAHAAERSRSQRPGEALLQRALWLLGLLAILPGVACMEEVSTDCCALGMRRMCLCEDGRESLQVCDSQGWGTCDCGCEPWATRECRCDDGEDGIQVCGEDYSWGSCHCDDPELSGQCTTGETYCPGVGCVNTAHSEMNCGACGIVCQGCDRCIRGECTTSCCETESNCGTVRDPLCVSLPSDLDHCGECGNVCGDDERCVAGSCII